MNILEINDLRKTFDDNQVLKGVSLTLEEGKVMSLIGSSGSGKTTLLRCITGLEKADSGIIKVAGNTLFDGERVGKRTSEENRKNQLLTGLVFQNFNLFPQYSVLKNVTLAKELLLKEEFKAKKVDKEERKKQLIALEKSLTPIRANCRAVSSRELPLQERLCFLPSFCALTSQPLHLTLKLQVKY